MEDLEDYYGLLGCDELSTVRYLLLSRQLWRSMNVIHCAPSLQLSNYSVVIFEDSFTLLA